MSPNFIDASHLKSNLLHSISRHHPAFCLWLWTTMYNSFVNHSTCLGNPPQHRNRLATPCTLSASHQWNFLNSKIYTRKITAVIEIITVLPSKRIFTHRQKHVHNKEQKTVLYCDPPEEWDLIIPRNCLFSTDYFAGIRRAHVLRVTSVVFCLHWTVDRTTCIRTKDSLT